MVKNLKGFLKVCNDLGNVCRLLSSDPFNETLNLKREQLLDERERLLYASSK